MKILFLIIVAFHLAMANQCELRNSTTPNKYYLSVNATIDCRNIMTVKCSHVFRNSCVESIEWHDHPANMCNKNNECCVHFDEYNHHNINFTCRCENSDPITFNDTLSVYMETCPHPTPSSESIGILGWLSIGTLIIGIPAVFIYAVVQRYRKSKADYQVISDPRNTIN